MQKPVRILMLHGYSQSGPRFRAKVRALEKNILKTFPQGAEFVYPTGPFRLKAVDMPAFALSGANDGGDNQNLEPEEKAEELDAWGWWTKDKFRTGVSSDGGNYVLGLEEGLETVAKVLKSDGPFDGVIGFSQGAAMAAIVASLLEKGRDEAFAAGVRKGEKMETTSKQSESESGSAALGELEALRYPRTFYADHWSDGLGDGNEGDRESLPSPSPSPSTTPLESTTTSGPQLIHPPLKFVVAYSGFRILPPYYSAFYEPSIQTPVMNVLGTNDTIVSEERSMALVDACEGGSGRDRLVYHPGGHIVPGSQRQAVMPVLAFIKAHL